MGIIYKATNKINGKSYIGQTIQKLSKRKPVHKLYSKKGTSGLFYSAILKYGWENFVWETIGEYDNSILGIMETMKIIIHNTYCTNNGYNMTYGGEGCIGYKHPKDVIDKMKNNHPSFFGK